MENENDFQSFAYFKTRIGLTNTLQVRHVFILQIYIIQFDFSVKMFSAFFIDSCIYYIHV